MNAGNPHLLPDPHKQRQAQAMADAQISERIRGSAIRIYEHLCVAYVPALDTTDEITGEPLSPELRPDQLMALAEQAIYMAPYVYARLGYIPSPVPADDPVDHA